MRKIHLRKNLRHKRKYHFVHKGKRNNQRAYNSLYGKRGKGFLGNIFGMIPGIGPLISAVL